MVELPREEKKQYDYLFEESTSFRNQKPTFVDIGQALKVRKQLNRLAETLQRDYANETVEAEQFSSLEDVDLMVEEVDWELINEDGEIEIHTLEDKEAVEEKKASEGRMTFKIIGNKPDMLYLDANLYIDPDFPKRVAITSPFGQHEDDWFNRHYAYEYTKK